MFPMPTTPPAPRPWKPGIWITRWRSDVTDPRPTALRGGRAWAGALLAGTCRSRKMNCSAVQRSLEAAAKVLAWDSLQLAARAMTDPSVIGEGDGWNLAITERVDGTLGGGCGYGSRIEIDPTGFWRVESCGGHWVQWSILDGWECDQLHSRASWGDIDQSGPGDYISAECYASRIQRMQDALDGKTDPATQVLAEPIQHRTIRSRRAYTP